MFFIYGVVTTFVYLLVYYIVKIKCIAKLRALIIFTNIVLILFSIYPILSKKEWNSRFWIVCVTNELLIIIFSLTIFRHDYKRKSIYEIINKNQLITIIGGRPFDFRKIKIEEAEKKLKSLFWISDKYIVPYNIVVMGNKGKCRNRIEFTFVFWKMIDFNRFVQSNPSLAIEEISRSKSGICAKTVIDF